MAKGCVAERPTVFCHLKTICGIKSAMTKRPKMNKNWQRSNIYKYLPVVRLSKTNGLALCTNTYMHTGALLYTMTLFATKNKKKTKNKGFKFNLFCSMRCIIYGWKTPKLGFVGQCGVAFANCYSIMAFSNPIQILCARSPCFG